jgi:hypothetical protein
MKRWVLSVGLFLISTAGLFVTFPLWLLNIISDRTLMGLTLVLSWMALQYESFNSMQIAHKEKGGANNGDEEGVNEDE